MKKTTVAVIFGGRESEHAVSCASAEAILTAGTEAGLVMIPVKIDTDGKWYVNDQKDGLPAEAAVTKIRELSADVVFPITHGRGGEDGVLQGFLETCKIPYIGCGVLASAICMDKVLQKLSCKAADIPVVPFVWGDRDSLKHTIDNVHLTIEQFHLPFFVKPSNEGSSVGISKVDRLEDLPHAIEKALLHDSRFLIEEGVENVRDISVGILQTSTGITFSAIDEVVTKSGFYDYDAKYDTKTSSAEHFTPARIHADLEEQIKKYSEKVWHHLACRGMARIDFLLNEKNELFFSEVNTLPGFTATSNYPRLFAAVGIPLPDLVKKLVEFSLYGA